MPGPIRTWLAPALVGLFFSCLAQTVRSESFLDWLRRDRDAMKQFKEQDSAPGSAAPQPTGGSVTNADAPLTYLYLYKGREVRLTASAGLVAVRGESADTRQAVSDLRTRGLERDPRNDRTELASQGVVLLRTTPPTNRAARTGRGLADPDGRDRRQVRP
jgi:hypothetical protein